MSSFLRYSRGAWWIAAAVLSTAFVALCYPRGSGGSAHSGINGLNFEKLREFTLKSSQQMSLKDHAVSISVFVRGEDRIEIKVLEDMDQPAVTKYFDQRAYMIKSLYDDQKLPYPGGVDSVLSCSEEFQPAETKESSPAFQKTTYSLMANARRTFGVCDRANVWYQARAVLLWCRKTRRLFDIQIFMRSAAAVDFPSLVGEVACEG